MIITEAPAIYNCNYDLGNAIKANIAAKSANNCVNKEMFI